MMHIDTAIHRDVYPEKNEFDESSNQWYIVTSLLDITSEKSIQILHKTQ